MILYGDYELMIPTLVLSHPIWFSTMYNNIRDCTIPFKPKSESEAGGDVEQRNAFVS